MEISLGEAITMTARNKPDALGAVYVPLNYRLRRGEIDMLVKRAEPVVFCYDVRYAELLEGLAEAHQSIRLFLALNDEYEALLAAGTEAEPPVVAGDRDVQSQRMMKAIVTEQIIEYRLHPDEVRYSAAPTYHITGICQLLMGVAYGTASVIVPQFSPRVTLDLMAAGRLTAVFMMPTMISTVLGLPDVHDHAYDRLELMYYGAAAMSPNLLRRAMDTFRWFRAGDMGYLDASGYLYLGGRKKDMIVRGGENIYPIEIESVLADHPAVAQSAVVGVPDEHWSEIVRAWVTLRPGAAATTEELAAHCGWRLATYKVPAEFRFADALPVNASGKILKRELRTWE